MCITKGIINKWKTFDKVRKVRKLRLFGKLCDDAVFKKGVPANDI